MAESGAIEPAELRDRERGWREREADVRVRELPAEACAPEQDDHLVVEGEWRPVVDEMPARVRRQLGVDVARHEAEERRRELSTERVPVGIAAGFELLEVRQLLHVDLVGEVAADRLLERFVGLEFPAGERPRPRVRFERPLPEKHLENAATYLEDDCGDGVGGGGFCLRVGNHVDSAQRLATLRRKPPPECGTKRI